MGQFAGLELVAGGYPRNKSDHGRGREEKERRRRHAVSTQCMVWSLVVCHSLTTTKKEREAGIFPKR